MSEKLRAAILIAVDCSLVVMIIWAIMAASNSAGLQTIVASAGKAANVPVAPRDAYGVVGQVPTA